MKNPFSRFFRARDKPGATDSVSSAPTFYFGSSAAGKSVTASTAIQMSTVYACVRVIAETIASLPLHVYQNQGEGSVKALEHPLYPILHDEPNSEIRATGCCLFFRMVIPRNASGKIIPAGTAGTRKSVRKPRRKPESSTRSERSWNHE